MTTPTTSRAAPGSRRASGERGSGLVAGIALMFAFTFLGLVWLANDVDRGVSNRSAAQSIAFQAARSGAQETSISDLRGSLTADAPSVEEGIQIDVARARLAAQRVASSLFASYGLNGSVTSIVVDADSVSVAVSVTDGGRTVTGSGTVRAERAP